MSWTERGFACLARIQYLLICCTRIKGNQSIDREKEKRMNKKERVCMCVCVCVCVRESVCVCIFIQKICTFHSLAVIVNIRNEACLFFSRRRGRKKRQKC